MFKLTLSNTLIKNGFTKCINLPHPNFGFCEAVSRHNFLLDPEGTFFVGKM